MTAVSPTNLTQEFPSILSRLNDGGEVLIRENGVTLAQIVLPRSEIPPGVTQEMIDVANAAVLRHVIRGIPSGGLDNESIDRDIARAIANEGQEP